MSEIKQNIDLNFLPLREQEFSFTVYRRLLEHKEKKWSDNIRRYNLPKNQDDTENFTGYWVSFSQFENSEPFTIRARTNIYLTEWYIYSLLLQNINGQEAIKIYNHKSDFNKLRIGFNLSFNPPINSNSSIEPIDQQNERF